MSSSCHAYDVDESSPSPSTSPIVKDKNVSLICYNMRGVGNDPTTDRLMLRLLLLSTSADIIILQEPTWVPRDFIEKHIQIDMYEYVGKEKQVGILYKHQIFKCIDENIPLPGEFNETFRNFIHTNSICVKFKHILHNYEILVVSYHSPVVGIDEDIRMDAINAMFQAIVNISQSFNPPLPIIGGADTNLDLSRALLGQLDKLTIDLNLPDDFVLHSEYTATERRTPPVIRRRGRPHLGKIDYFFHYPTNLELNMTKVMDVNEHSTLVQNLFNTSVDIKNISNHDPLIATMTNNITTCFQNEKPHDEEEEEDESEEEEAEDEDDDEDEDESDEEEDEEQESEESDEDDDDESEDEDSDYDSINIDNSNSDSDCDSDNDNTDIDDEYEYTYYHDGRVVDSDGVDSDGEHHY